VVVAPTLPFPRKRYEFNFGSVLRKPTFKG
jgi:hypothetical protein